MRKFNVMLLGAAALLALGCRTNESPERQVDDVQITAQVKSKLAADIGLTSVTNISVNSTNGIVTLAGQVDSAEIKAKAEAAARSVPNVVRVIDNFQLASSTVPRPNVRSRTLSGTALAVEPALLLQRNPEANVLE